MTCIIRYVLIAGKCTKVSDLCQTWDSAALCTSCYNGYYLSNGVCSAGQPSTDTGCLTYDANGNCIACANRYVFQNGVCIKVSDTCQTWDSTGACTSCYSGWSLSNGVCSYNSPSSQSDPLCVTYAADGSCSVCSYRSVLTNGKCVAVSDLCNTWDSTTALCTSCYGGYTLVSGVCK